MGDLTHFANCLRAVRAEARMTQHELAERAGVHYQSIARMELATREPSWVMVQKLARALGVSVLAFVDPAILPPPVEIKRGRGRPRLDGSDVKQPRNRKGTEK